MKKNFSFNKFRIKDKNKHFYFFEAFNNDKKTNNIIRFKSFLNKREVKEKEIKLPKIELNKDKTPKKLYMSKLETKFSNIKNTKNETKSKTDIKINNNNTLIHKKKQKTIPINKVNQCQNINQNFIININNNNNINNNYKIKMNKKEELKQKKPAKNNYNFSKIKIVGVDDFNNNKNINAPKSNYSELSELSCFYSNKKVINLNSINSFVNNDNDIFSISEDVNTPENCEINLLDKNKDKNFMKECRKIYINPDEFKKFCKEVNEILNC